MRLTNNLKMLVDTGRELFPVVGICNTDEEANKLCEQNPYNAVIGIDEDTKQIIVADKRSDVKTGLGLLRILSSYIEKIETKPSIKTKPSMENPVIKVTVASMGQWRTATSHDYKVVKIVGALHIEVFVDEQSHIVRVDDILDEKVAERLGNYHNIELTVLPKSTLD